MANVNVTSDSWTEISITSGTVQNISATADIELSAEQTDNSGVVLKPSELYQWDNETIYARAVTESKGALRVVNFKKAAGGGGSYVLPVASSSTLGGVKIGSNLSIDESGVLSATGGGAVNYSTTEQQIGTWIDGKPLYQITLTGNLPTTTTPTPVIDLGTLYNVDSVTEISGYIVYEESGSSGFWMINSGATQSAQVRISIIKNLLITSTSDSIGLPYYITIKYTKTTD